MRLVELFTDLINKYPELKVELNQPLSKYTYTKTGGPADAIVFPKNQSEVQAATSWTQEHNIPLTVIGNGSNLIIKDGGIRGLVMILTDLLGHLVRDGHLTVTSGEKLIYASELAYSNGLTGLEFACGIPGSVGGAVYMNAGAYGGEMAEVVEEVMTIDQKGDLKVYDNAGCDFGYRHSAFMDNDEIIVQVTFNLKSADPAKIKAEMDDLTKRRENSQPLDLPSCGSVFKRPEGHYAGKLIQDAGLQGYRIGGVEVSKKHAGFMVNVDNGTASDYLELIKHVQKTVKDQTGVQLEPEVLIIGEDKK